MAVRCPKKTIPRSCFSSTPKDRKSRYSLRNSSFNLSNNTSPKKRSVHLRSSFDTKNALVKEEWKEQDKKKVYSLRNSTINLCNDSPPSRTVKSVGSILNKDLSTRKVSKNMVCKQEKMRQCKLKNSRLSQSENSQLKRTANCMEFTPKAEHPMRKKLRELACIPSTKNTKTNLSLDLDLNKSVLTRNQRRSLNSVSSKPLGSKSPEKKNSLRSGQLRMNVLKMRNIPTTDTLVLEKYKEGNIKKLKSEFKTETLNVKNSFVTPVIKQKFSRSLRIKDTTRNLSSEENIPRPLSGTYVRVADSLKVKYSNSMTPVTTQSQGRTSKLENQSEKVTSVTSKRGRKKKSVVTDSVGKTPSDDNKFNCEVENAAPSKRGRKKKSFVTDSVSKTRSDENQYPCVDAEENNLVKGKDQEGLRRKTRNSGKVPGKNLESTVERRLTRSTAFESFSDVFHPSEGFPKKPKRNTYPKSNKNSKNQVTLHSVGGCSNVPIDVLIQPPGSFHESVTHTPKTFCVSVRKIAPKASLKAKNVTLEMTPVPKKSLSKKSLVPKKSLSKKSPVPKKSSSEKSTSKPPERATLDSSKKIPRIGTLKRKRWIMKTLKEKSEGYEDDIFENQKIQFPMPIMISDDESDATDVSVATPVCGFLLTPNIQSKSPLYKPCISSNDLTAARKIAEEYLYRRKRTWKMAGKNESENKTVAMENNQVSEKNALADVLKARADIEKLNQEESEEEDEYFSDVS